MTPQSETQRLPPPRRTTAPPRSRETLSSRDKSIWWWVGSAIAHALLFFTLPRNPLNAPPKPTVIDFLSEKEMREMLRDTDKKKQVAETVDSKDQNPDPNAKFLGEKTQTAREQTRAARIDKFQNAPGTGTRPSPSQSNAAKETAPEATSVIGEGSVQAPQPKKDWKQLSLSDLSVGTGPSSASDDALRDLKVGANTVLSTREFKYYSYYQRIKELLRQHWRPGVERRLTVLWARGKQISEEELVTKLLIVLNGDGTVSKISHVAGSGFAELDEAAVEAFQKAAPFPHPPKGIIDPDGFARIRWDFILKTESAPVIQFRAAGTAPY